LGSLAWALTPGKNTLAAKTVKSKRARWIIIKASQLIFGTISIAVAVEFGRNKC
jgi:hypothetical protein